jgi:hypothetical protein
MKNIDGVEAMRETSQKAPGITPLLPKAVRILWENSFMHHLCGDMPERTSFKTRVAFIGGHFQAVLLVSARQSLISSFP